MKKRIIPILLTASMLSLCACGSSSDGQTKDDGKAQGASSGTETVSETDNGQESSAGQEAGSTAGSDTAAGKTMTDPSGAEVTIPEQVDSIIVLAPVLSQLVTDLDMGDKVIAYDTYSTGIEGLPEDVPTFDVSNPDMEQLTALAPDMLLVSNETFFDQESPFEALIDAGTCVICVPTSDDIQSIKSEIAFMATALDASEKGQELLDELDAELERLSEIAKGIPEEERKQVYFEIAPAPNMYSFGSGVYLNEMIEWIGAENILAGQSGWLTVEGETIVDADPDFIFTNVDYADDPVQEILDRDGWADISAVSTKNVYYIDKDNSSQPNQNIVKAMRQMAEILYPEYYKAE